MNKLNKLNKLNYINYYIMSNLLSFIGGTIFGAYISQNYDIPNVKKTGEIIIEYIKSLEKDNKKK